MLGFPSGSLVMNSPASAGDMGLIPGSERCPGEGNDNPLQYPCLGNPMNRGAWQETYHQNRIFFSLTGDMRAVLSCFSHVQLFATLWTI